ncbi:TetR/AcrR family transcriptional regulator [Levilactobacillus brevis]|uniref:TetR/AcrR family transcriptional regulator n=1 Tax=Levilactobacillus brevis TaxID=1580 RepID=UPI000BE9E248|nr:TetR/AcrR family transcriptional regulator [Levilactobacillus brevis]MBT9676242.1 TetR family transcriptional regulator [Levilactobacillus brevis]MBY7146595.1 TetR/AcrR family transcriptional regulator [Levilactobacillus brevis]MCM6796633.1 TetR/AcrR family transcriptional regulator [Levilactobacillus brevis]MCZ2118841.1 TetR/AcrR family transcriptional regulator [Levilactobacillus brevis]MCZ2124327.1 TetR/AcrR family transcriptional regulator [Levilactobacillus brevis]
MAATKHAQQIKQDSQDYLATALLQLLATKDLADLTVTQVVKRAGVSRMAFYRNFNTLDDVLTAYFGPIITARFADIAKLPTADKLQALGDFFTSFSTTLKLSADRGFEHIIRQVFNDNMRTFYATNATWRGITSTQQTYWISFMSAGVYAIWRDWLLGGQQESLTTIHDLIATFQQTTMMGLLQQDKS